jgi:hypothetical protein
VCNYFSLVNCTAATEELQFHGSRHPAGLKKLFLFSPRLGGIRDDLDAYRHALKIESEIVHFFESVAQLETNQDAKALLLEIAGEEKKVYDAIENITDFVAVPNTHSECIELAT